MRVNESYESETWQKIYEPEHIQEVLTEIEKNLQYFNNSRTPNEKRLVEYNLPLARIAQEPVRQKNSFRV